MYAETNPATASAAGHERHNRNLGAVAAARVNNSGPRCLAAVMAGLVAASVGDKRLAFAWIAGLAIFVLCDRWVFARLARRSASGQPPPAMGPLIAWVGVQSVYTNTLGVILWFAPNANGPILSVFFLCAGLASAGGTLRHCLLLAAAGLAPAAIILLGLPVVQFVMHGGRDPFDLLPLAGGLLLLGWGTRLWNSLVASDEALALAEAASLREQQAAAAASAARTDALAQVADDFRVPLEAMLGACENLRRAASTPAAREYVGMLVQVNGVLGRVIDDIGRQGKGHRKLLLAPERVDPRELVRGAVGAFRTSAQDKSIELFLDVAPDTPALVETDPVRIRQVLLNLLANAVQSTTYGGVRVKLSALPSERARHVRLAFSVADTGQGVARSQLARLTAGQEDAAENGAGRALAKAVQLAKLLGGDIGAASEQGQGSRFTLVVDVPVVSSADQRAA